MYSCAFFGHRTFDYGYIKGDVEACIVELIEKKGVTQFYCGGRGKFDRLCASIIKKLKEKYAFIRCTQVLSYIPKKKEEDSLFDGSIYLLEQSIPPLYAIVETNKLLVDKVQYIISGVNYSFGGAYQAVEYANKRQKQIINVFER